MLLKRLLNHLCGDVPLSAESLLELTENNYDPDSLLAEIWNNLTVDQKKSAILSDKELFNLVDPMTEQAELIADTLHLIGNRSIFFDLAKRSEKKLRVALAKFENTPEEVLTQLIDDNRTTVLNAVALHGSCEHRLKVAKKITDKKSTLTDSSEIALTLLTGFKGCESEMLINIMNHPDCYIRAYAVDHLALHYDNEALAELLHRATSDENEYVAEFASKALETLNDR